MSLADQKMSLEAFLALRAPELQEDLGAERGRLMAVTRYLGEHLARHPDLATQVRRLGDAVPDDIADLDDATRRAAVTEAEKLASDVKARWIAADAPPLVDEVDGHLDDVADALARMRRPGPEALREAARRIDRLGRIGAQMEGIEHRYLPWVIGGAVLFVAGLVLFFAPGLLNRVPFLASFWTILICLGALPAVGIHYARRVLPRSQADTEIDQINREYFIPYGGLYFPESEGPACVITLRDSPKQTEGAKAREERRRHRNRSGPMW